MKCLSLLLFVIFQALSRLKEKNENGETPFDLSISRGHLKCVKHLIQSSWLENNLDIKQLINVQSIKKAIDQNQVEILKFFLSNPKRFSYIIDLFVDYHGHYFNLVCIEKVCFSKNVSRLNFILTFS